MEDEIELQARVIEVLNICYANNKCETKAEFAAEIGTNYLQLYRWMSGKTIPRKKALKKICDVCGVDYYTVTNIEDTLQHPYKGLTLGGVVNSYEDLIENSTPNDPEALLSRQFLVALCCILIHQAFIKVGLASKVEIQQAGSKGNLNTRITFQKPELFDLNVSVHGTLDSIFFKCNSNTALDRSLAKGRVTSKDIGSLATLIVRNYIKA
jgi:hypothetical protein